MKRVTEVCNLGLVAIVCICFLHNRVHADTIYVSSYYSSAILKLDPNLTGDSVFASGFSGGTGLAFDDNGNLYAANAMNNAIYKFDSTGHLSLFASSASLIHPSGIVFDRSGNLYVASDSSVGAGQILEFDASGNMSVFASNVPLFGLPHATGLAFDNGGNLYVASVGASGQILKFDPSGNRSAFVSGLNQPTGLAFDSSGNLYVGVYDNGFGTATIQRIDASGNKFTFASGGDLSSPEGLAFDSSGNLYVANQSGWTIEKFDSSGNEVRLHDGNVYNPLFIAVQVPEPATWLLSILAIGVLIAGRRS